MKGERVMKLILESDEKGTTIKLDDYELQNVTDYKLEGSSQEGTELTVKMSIMK